MLELIAWLIAYSTSQGSPKFHLTKKSISRKKNNTHTFRKEFHPYDENYWLEFHPRYFQKLNKSQGQNILATMNAYSVLFLDILLVIRIQAIWKAYSLIPPTDSIHWACRKSRDQANRRQKQRNMNKLTTLPWYFRPWVEDQFRHLGVM